MDLHDDWTFGGCVVVDKETGTPIPFALWADTKTREVHVFRSDASGALVLDHDGPFEHTMTDVEFRVVRLNADGTRKVLAETA